MLSLRIADTHPPWAYKALCELVPAWLSTILSCHMSLSPCAPIILAFFLSLKNSRLFQPQWLHTCYSCCLPQTPHKPHCLFFFLIQLLGSFPESLHGWLNLMSLPWDSLTKCFLMTIGLLRPSWMHLFLPTAWFPLLNSLITCRTSHVLTHT